MTTNTYHTLTIFCSPFMPVFNSHVFLQCPKTETQTVCVRISFSTCLVLKDICLLIFQTQADCQVLWLIKIWELHPSQPIKIRVWDLITYVYIPDLVWFRVVMIVIYNVYTCLTFRKAFGAFLGVWDKSRNKPDGWISLTLWRW